MESGGITRLIGLGHCIKRRVGVGFGDGFDGVGIWLGCDGTRSG